MSARAHALSVWPVVPAVVVSPLLVAPGFDQQVADEDQQDHQQPAQAPNHQFHRFIHAVHRSTRPVALVSAEGASPVVLTGPELDAAIVTYKAALAAFDWTFQHSDDHSAWKRGKAALATLHDLQERVDPLGGIWYAHIDRMKLHGAPGPRVGVFA